MKVFSYVLPCPYCAEPFIYLGRIPKRGELVYDMVRAGEIVLANGRSPKRGDKIICSDCNQNILPVHFDHKNVCLTCEGI